MTLREIVVQVDETDRCAPRLRAAAELAQRFRAHLSGTFMGSEIPPEFLMEDDSYLVITPALVADLMQTHKAALQERSEIARKRFEAAAARSGAPSDWRVVTGDVRAHLVAAGRRADLLVVPRSATSCLGRQRVEAADLALACGGPVLVTPDEEFGPTLGKRILLAWDGGREASRALRDAWPLLAEAEEVHVLTVSPEPQAAADPGLRRLMEAHGLSANLIVERGPDAAAGELLERHAAALNADLVVMGLYGRTRLQELVLGGVSRHMLKDLSVPLLVSH